MTLYRLVYTPHEVKLFKEPFIFEWDKGNKDKNWTLHQVTYQECEEVFYDPKKKVFKDNLHSGKEERYLILGNTKRNRLLFVAFTQRGDKLRVISARHLNKKERFLYEEET